MAERLTPGLRWRRSRRRVPSPRGGRGTPNPTRCSIASVSPFRRASSAAFCLSLNRRASAYERVSWCRRQAQNSLPPAAREPAALAETSHCGPSSHASADRGIARGLAFEAGGPRLNDPCQRPNRQDGVDHKVIVDRQVALEQRVIVMRIPVHWRQQRRAADQAAAGLSRVDNLSYSQNFARYRACCLTISNSKDSESETIQPRVASFAGMTRDQKPLV